ncbi:ATP-dependent DNA helicase PIF1, partial [Metarhizium majus ARSEF 297]
MDHTYLATRYRKGGKDSQDSPSTAEARVKLAAIQRDHRSRRRAGETVPLTPTISQLRYFQGSEVAGEDARTGGFRGVGMVSKEGDDRGQFSESDIDAEDYANVLLSPARPRRYLEQLGIEPDSEPGEGAGWLDSSERTCITTLLPIAFMKPSDHHPCLIEV